jgi:hypothetical protein
MLAGSFVFAVAIVRSGVPLTSAGQQLFGELSLGTSFAIVGWILATRRSGNPLGWLYLAIGVSQVGNGLASVASTYAYTVATSPFPGADLLSWVSLWSWVPGFGLFASFGILLFPDGRLPSPRWRPIAVAAVIGMALLAIPVMIGAWPMRGIALIGEEIHVSDVADRLQLLGLFLTSVVALASIASIVVRFRRGDWLARRQLSWFLWAAAVEMLFVVGSGFWTFPPIVWLLGGLLISPLLPAAIGIAILRYRLYEIDRIVSRTIAYAIVTGMMGTLFVVTIIGLQALLVSVTQTATIAVAASTLLAAALFQPLRHRVQRTVDRRFDRSRVDGERMATDFADRMRDQVDIDSVAKDLAWTIDAAVRPASQNLWLRRAA